MALLIEVPEWQWYYDPALDSLLLTSTFHERLYIFLQHVFMSLSSIRFQALGSVWRDPTMRDFSLAIPPQPSLLASLEFDALEVDTSASSSFHVPACSDGPPGGSESADLMESGSLPTTPV